MALRPRERPEPTSSTRGRAGRGLALVSETLPDFSLDGYAKLLQSLRSAGYRLAPAGAMRAAEPSPTVYLRHDVDLHILHIDRIARIEAELGVGATYYVALTQPYNALSPDNVMILRELICLGHELGLHYDLTCYPVDFEAALERLESEISVLERFITTKVRSICMHQPHTGHENLFASCDRWLNPHDPRLQEGLLYVSDSCRGWRDESLLACFGANPPHRVMLNTHPELWLDGAILARERYLERIVLPNSIAQQSRYIDDTVRTAWRNHTGGRAHDARVAAARASM
jgi:hypothetical protein